MKTAKEYIELAERAIHNAARASANEDKSLSTYWNRQAQVYATLANAAATWEILNPPISDLPPPPWDLTDVS